MMIRAANASDDSNDYNDLEVAAVLANVSDVLSDGATKDGTLSSSTSNSLIDCSPFNQKISHQMSTTSLTLSDASSSVRPNSVATLNVCQLAAKGELIKLRQLITDEILNSFDERRRTPLMAAVGASWLHVVQFLLDRGADLDLVDDKGTTALMQACSIGQHGIVSSLLQHGAEVNVACQKGNTALHYAVFGNHLECVRQLLVWGADMTIKNNDGITCDVLAARLGFQAVQDAIYTYVLNALTEVLS